MTRYRVIAAAALAFGLTGCATLDEDSCRSADWGAVGFADGADGYGPDRILAHARACNDYGIAPVRATWEAGRQDGLALYCTPDRAWHEGADGDRLRPVCTGDNLAQLRRANDRGLQYHRIGRDIDEAERRIAEISRLLRDMADTDPSRATLTAERSILRLEVLQLRMRRSGYRL